MKKALTLSVVIPVYNEADQIEKCLKSVNAQTLQPSEILVVDNNSTDSTVEIAKKHKNVKILSESRQGVIYAARCGFDSATGDVICRIDADTILPDNWLLQVKNFFDNNESDAITGDCYFYDFPFRKLVHDMHHFVYYNLQKYISGTEILWGSNMAIKNSSWVKIRPELVDSKKIHEDIDMSLRMDKQQMKITRLHTLVAEVSLRRGNIDPIGTLNYLLPWPYTYWANDRRLQAILVGFLLICVFVLLLPVMVLTMIARFFR